MLQQNILGGLVGLNRGQIQDSFSKVNIRGTGSDLCGGFCGKNTGRIVTCAAAGRLTHPGQRSGFTPPDAGTEENCVWLRRNAREKEQERWSDWDRSRMAEELSGETLPGWDLRNVWHLDAEADSLCPLGLYDVAEPAKLGSPVVEINTAGDLLELAAAVNRGEAAPGTVYRLNADVNLGGRAWTPIGMDQNAPFLGCFDGNGHQIFNFKVRAAKHPFAGLFGCIGERGRVLNLTVDVVLLGRGSVVGPLCGLNSGHIVNCVASGCVDRCRYTGGLVGQNNGTILRSAAYGRVSRGALVPWWSLAVLLALLCALPPVYFAVNAQAKAQEVFAPVILDPNAVPVDPEQELPPTEEEQDTSASFVLNAEMELSTENYAGRAGLRCPSWSTRGFVATFRLTAGDQEAIGYAGDGGMVPLYQSGLIAPGYGVDVITLGPLPDGRTLPAGEYELSVLLEFYDVETNEKSAVVTEVPVEVTVREP